MRKVLLSRDGVHTHVARTYQAFTKSQARVPCSMSCQRRIHASSGPAR